MPRGTIIDPLTIMTVGDLANLETSTAGFATRDLLPDYAREWLCAAYEPLCFPDSLTRGRTNPSQGQRPKRFGLEFLPSYPQTSRSTRAQ